MAQTKRKAPTGSSMGPHINLFSEASRHADRLLKDAIIEGRLSEYIATEPLLMADSEFVSFHKPTDLLVSRHYPGYRVFEMGGTGADETLGLLLAQSLDSEASLEVLRSLLSTPDVPIEIINQLLPRITLTARRGRYMMSEQMIIDTTAKVLANRTSDANVISAIAHVHTEVLSHMGMVIKGPERKIIRTASSYALRMNDIRRLVLIESLRDIFSGARIAEATKLLDSDATPNLIGESIAKMLRHASHSIPEIRLRLEQLNIVNSLVQLYYREPHKLSNTMRASTTLASLASYANFLADAVVNETPVLITHSNSDMREACSSILTIIQSAPSIESIPLVKYADYFGLVPCAAADGIYRGLVAYTSLGQVSKLDVVNCYSKGTKSPASELALLPTEYVPVTTLAPEVNRNLLAVDATHGLANLVADEIAVARFMPDDLPALRTIGMTPEDVVYLAMSRAEIVAVTKSAESMTTFTLVYAAKISEYWRTKLNAATPTISYFSDPQSLLVYQAGAQSRLPTTFPVRSQTLELSAAFDTMYHGNVDPFLNKDITKPYVFTIALENPNNDSNRTELKLKISPLELLVGPEPNVNRGGAFYAMINEPGVDRDVALAMSIASAFCAAGPQIVSDKAKSWVVETLTPMATHPAITRVATKALHQAVINEQLDARKLAPQWKEVVVKAYFGTLLAILYRFNKIDEVILNEINANLPVNALSVKAALALATIPTALDASVTDA
jgi:hypothetical protein